VTGSRDRVHLLTERLVHLTGCSNLVELALSPGRLDGLDPTARRALELRLGLDRLRAGRPAGARTAEEVAAEIGGDAADVERTIDEALDGLRPAGVPPPPAT
jgi:hypothetical protein